MDKAIYIGMTGATSSMHQLEMVTNNLANLNTTGFRADNQISQQHSTNKNGLDTRVYSTIGSSYSRFETGPILDTGRDLDIAISGSGFISVQSKSGQEGYTRAGNLKLADDGLLVTRNNEPVLGRAGVIRIPPSDKINIGTDGSVSVQLLGTTQLITLDQIKFVDPPIENLQKGQDGLFYLSGDAQTLPSIKVKVVPGALEGSNVNAVETLTQLIDLSRHFEMHTNLMKSTSDNSGKANQLLEVSRS